jgi:hypothetical protein
MARRRRQPRSAVCHKCGRTIHARKSKSSGRMSLWSGIRKHYWDWHHITMYKGVKKRMRRKNPCWKPKRRYRRRRNRSWRIPRIPIISDIIKEVS